MQNSREAIHNSVPTVELRLSGQNFPMESLIASTNLLRGTIQPKIDLNKLVDAINRVATVASSNLTDAYKVTPASIPNVSP